MVASAENNITNNCNNNMDDNNDKNIKCSKINICCILCDKDMNIFKYLELKTTYKTNYFIIS